MDTQQLDPQQLINQLIEAVNAKMGDFAAKLEDVFNRLMNMIGADANATGSCQRIANGRDAVVAATMDWIRAFPDAKFEATTTHVANDVAVVEGTFTGTHDGILSALGPNIPASGRPVSTKYVAVIQFNAGQVTSLRFSFDRLDLLQQIGQVPAIPALTTAIDQIGPIPAQTAKDTQVGQVAPTTLAQTPSTAQIGQVPATQAQTAKN